MRVAILLQVVSILAVLCQVIPENLGDLNCWPLLHLNCTKWLLSMLVSLWACVQLPQQWLKPLTAHLGLKTSSSFFPRLNHQSLQQSPLVGGGIDAVLTSAHPALPAGPLSQDPLRPRQPQVRQQPRLLQVGAGGERIVGALLSSLKK